MARNSKVKQEITAPVGLNLYQDEKNRTIYKHPFLKQAVYIPTYDYRTFELYRKRYILAISVFVVLFTLLNEWFGVPFWVSIAISVLVWLFLEWKFYKFLQTEQPVKKFQPKTYKDYYDNFEAQSTEKIVLKTILYLLLGALIVYNSYYSNYQGLYIIASWAVLALCIAYAIFQIVVLVRVKARKNAG